MSDRYSQLVRLPVAGGLAKRVGLPQPVTLERPEVLEREGASVVRLDLRDAEIELDITADDAPDVLAARFADGSTSSCTTRA